MRGWGDGEEERDLTLGLGLGLESYEYKLSARVFAPGPAGPGFPAQYTLSVQGAFKAPDRISMNCELEVVFVNLRPFPTRESIPPDEFLETFDGPAQTAVWNGLRVIGGESTESPARMAVDWFSDVGPAPLGTRVCDESFTPEWLVEAMPLSAVEGVEPSSDQGVDGIFYRIGKTRFSQTDEVIPELFAFVEALGDHPAVETVLDEADVDLPGEEPGVNYRVSPDGTRPLSVTVTVRGDEELEVTLDIEIFRLNDPTIVIVPDGA